MLQKEQIISLVSNSVQFGKVAPNARAAAIAKFCKLVSISDGADYYIRELRPSETEGEKDQRLRVTYNIAPYAAGKVKEFIRRLDSVEDVKIDYGFGDNKEAETRIRKMAKNFYNKKSLLDYCIDAYVKSQGTDPNALILLTNVPIYKNGALVENRVKPSIIPFSSVLRKEYDVDGRLTDVLTTTTRQVQYLKAPNDIAMKSMPTLCQIEVNDFTFYGDNITLIFIYDETQLQEGQTIDPLPFELDGMKFDTVKFRRQGTEDEYDYYKVYSPDTFAPCPVFDISLREDDVDSTVKTSVLMNAENIFLELIARKSELGAAINAQVFMQKYMVVVKCDHEQNNNVCKGGMCGTERCRKCEGKGSNMIKSSQQTVVYKVNPDTPPSEFPDITKMVHYVQVPLEIPHMLEGFVDRCMLQISDATYGVNLFGNTFNASVGRNETGKATRTGRDNETATKTNIDFSRAHKAIRPDAQAVSALWVNFVTYMSAINFPTLEISPSMDYPIDLNLLTIEELTAEYEAAVNAGLPVDVTERILLRIIEKSYPDNEMAVLWAKFKLNHRPFADKSSEEIREILMTRGEKDFDAVLWQHYDTLMDLIKNKQGESILMKSYVDQRLLIQAETTLYADSIIYAKPENFTAAFAETEN